MAIAEATGAATPSPPEQRFVLYGATWKAYQALLTAVGERPVRLTYDRGKLELMSPSAAHEIFARWLGRFVDLLGEELNIPLKGCRTTTCQREDLERGLEPDECFYLAGAARVHDWNAIDLSRDPPPDLAIEVDISRNSANRMGIYAALRVPEVWRFDGETLQVFRLTAAGEYERCERSPSFAFVPLDDLVPFLRQSVTTADDTALTKALRAWIRNEILPRFRADSGGAGAPQEQ